MARFDVCRFKNKSAPLVLDVQADLLSGLASRVVVPLAPARKAAKESLPRLKPRLKVDGKDYVLMTTDIAALPSSQIGAYVTNVKDEYQDEVTSALDFLFLGF